ncbi:PHP domain-containing protein [Lacimicrobium sp. SS2-24]|uniref:PHP domain-containing protein n=1 Tax=Lacimicrobium sp. SS2-24 TaxID=2005569 RepID=UPI000B4C1AB8|nr:PHP domain-containing protein [Lacimicrobium sp. SS2-24]
MKIDLHSHTYYSDGALSPKELIDRAHNMQVDVLAITDHDTTAALPEAMAYQATQKRALQIVPGIEFSTRWHGFDIHILGLNLDYQDDRFCQRVATQGERRELRARQMAEKLAKCGIEGVYEDAKTLAGPGQLTRSHFARVLVKRQVVKDFEQAFKRYLAKGKRAFVSPAWPEIHEVVAWIKEAGGEAVLAHPARYDMTSKWLKRLLTDFSEAGGDGMEVSHPQLAADTRKLLAQYAKDYALKASVGSDFHFPSRWTELGKNLSLADDLVPIWQHWTLA